MMVHRITHLSRSLVLALSLVVVGTASAQAQDDQEYKRAFNAGLEAANAKDYAAAYEHFNKAAPLAQQAGDEETASKAVRVLSQLDYRNGTAAIKAGNFETALSHFDTGIEHNARNPKNYLGKGLALKKLDRIEEAMLTFVEASEVGSATGDHKTARSAVNAIRDHYTFQASSLLSNDPSAQSAEKAIGHLTAMQEYVEADADTYYYLAEAHRAKLEYDAAVQMADKALEIHRGSRTAKAKIYFVKGEALMSLQEWEDAKTAFQNASYGSYREAAEHYLETLKTS